MKEIKINKGAFTMVELIIVLIILVILVTIAFMNIQNYPTKARDSERLSEMRGLYSKINAEILDGKPKLRDLMLKDSVDSSITGTGVFNGYLAHFGELDATKVGESQEAFSDPLTGKPYSYLYIDGAVGNPPKKISCFEIGSFSEEKYRNMYIGNCINFPELNSGKSSSGNDLFSLSGSVSLMGQIGLDSIEGLAYEGGSGAGGKEETQQKVVESPFHPHIDFTPYKVNTTTHYWFRYVIGGGSWSEVDPNCDKPDLQVLKEPSGEVVDTWAGCNSTLDDGIIEPGIYERGKDYSVRTPTEGDKNASNVLAQETNSNYLPSIWGKLYNYDKANTVACPDGWHVPSDAEWLALGRYVSGCTNLEPIFGTRICVGAGHVHKNGNASLKPEHSLFEMLGLNLGGRRKDNGVFQNRGLRSAYRTSTDYNRLSFYSLVSRSEWSGLGFGKKFSGTENWAFPVRCKKD